jgi:hypothetical protein
MSSGAVSSLSNHQAVAVDGAQLGVLQAPDRLVGVLGRVRDVRPVEQRRHAGVDRLERAEVVARVDVLRPVGGGELVEHDVEVAAEADVRRDAADHGLPGVPMRVDEPGHDDAARDVDDLGLGRVDAVSDGRDALAFDEDVGSEEVPRPRIHREDVTAAEQNALGHPHHLFLSTRAVRRTLAASRDTERLSRDSYHLRRGGCKLPASDRLGVD